MEEKLKIEYTIISRGTEKYGSKGYMAGKFNHITKILQRTTIIC